MTTLERVQASLRQGYIETMPTKLSVFEQSAQLLRNSFELEETISTTRRLAHQIRGAAASFGFASLGVTAGGVEDAPDELLEEKVGNLIRELRSIVVQESTPSSSILIVEDDEEVANFIVVLCSQPGRIVQVAHSCEEARELFRKEKFDLVMLDLILPDGDGRDLLTEIREFGNHQDTAIIVLSAKSTPLVKAECAVYGVEVFIEKPIIDELVPTVVAACLERHHGQRRDAFLDELTQVNNRAGFRKMFDQLRAVSQRNKRPLSLALLDIDRFKILNDQFGHQIGDAALVSLADRMVNTLRGSDLFGRWGGEEFVIAFPETDAESAALAVRKVADGVRGRSVTVGCDATLTFSAGVVEMKPGESLDLALLRADQLLYAAKRAGRDRVLTRTISKRPVKVLVVEDDPAVALQLVAALRESYDVRHAIDGGAAMKLARELEFALVILDYHLPDMTGVNVLTALRALPRYRTTPILMLTGAASDQLVEEAFAAGADDYIVKPFRPRALRSRVQRRLKTD